MARNGPKMGSNHSLSAGEKRSLCHGHTLIIYMYAEGPNLVHRLSAGERRHANTKAEL